MAVSSQSSPQDPGARLDSWKAIATYLGRDVATVRRWEKELSLPVRRVPGGRGRSVFAYTAEIDAWLKATPEPTAPVVAAAVTSASPPRPSARTAAITAAIAVIVIAAASWSAIAWFARPADLDAATLRVQTTSDGVVAFDADGREQWRHLYPAAYRTFYSEVGAAVRVVSKPAPAIYVATSHHMRRDGDIVEGGTLRQLDGNGHLQRVFSFDDEVSFGETKYAAPWAITAFAVEETSPRPRVAVAAHHWLWHPGLVTVLDDQWRRQATFANTGWVETVRWMPDGKLLIAGFSEPRDGGMVGLLDPAALNGQSDEARGSPYYCDSCGPDRPLRMIAMPRSEVNRVTVSRFNRAVVELTTSGVIVRTIEMPTDGQGAIDALYEFTNSLDLVSATYSPRYWTVHDTLYADKTIDHPREQCPDRHGPREVHVWDRDRGWRLESVRRPRQ